MLRLLFLWGMALVLPCFSPLYAQVADTSADSIHMPSGVLKKWKDKSSDLNQRFTHESLAYLRRMSEKESRLQQQLSKVDSNAAKKLFFGVKDQYAHLEKRIATDSGSTGQSVNGSYLPYLDSARGALSFLKKNSQLLDARQAGQCTAAFSQLAAFQSKLQDADDAGSFIRQRKEEIGQFIATHPGLQNVLGNDYSKMKQEMYYYSQQMRQYKEMWSDPDLMEQKALALLNKLPAFQTFMKNNSQLGGLFGLPASYSSSSLSGLQTRDQVAQLIQGQAGANDASGMASMQSSVESAQSQLDGYKDKIGKLGQGNGDMDMPDFKPNDQRSKTFLRRLVFGVNLQTTHKSYYFPTVTDLGLSLGYGLGHSNEIGLGASYKIGWGNGWQHIALSSQGAGIRSFVDIHIKNSFSATGGFEMNYTQPFGTYRELTRIKYWTQSGLIGIEKAISMKNRVFKKTKLQLLWDFLSYQQVPKTPSVLFRIGYTF